MPTDTIKTNDLLLLDPVKFPPLVLELWRRSGWAIDEQADWDDTYLATDEARNTQIVLRTLTHADDLVSGTAIRDANQTKERYGTDGVTVVSPIGFTETALAVADAHGVDVVGPDAVVRIMDALGASNLVFSPSVVDREQAT